ncbi:hypothetical protein DPMN_089089 [Dreissena polymorpha]|uniref:Uncharacterized protein n=1 Tax=Dreissena polymorpha TaxID=45954 RepID=A0A9D4QXW1_DREPO|nr:hypothetical protein DPMN_089089 [Dreissena polymorpha]
MNLFREKASVPEAPMSLFSPLRSPDSWLAQMLFLSSIPNNHKWQLKKVIFSQWLPLCDKKYKPASARNQILYYFHDGYLSEVFDVCLKRKHMKTLPSTSTVRLSPPVSSDLVDDDQPPPQKRYRREVKRRLTLSD